MPNSEDSTLDDRGDDSLLREALGMSARAPTVLAIGQVVDGTYRVDGLIGEGGMGRVYRAHDLKLDRDVALKLHSSVTEDARLMREATALAQLVHANVVTVYEVGTWNGHPWVAMEYVDGGNARQWLAREPRTPPQILAVYLAAARGLAAAHAVGLVHRDFKPDNVLVGDDGRVRVADFGLACAIGEPNELAMGTPAYMAPEQRSGGTVDARADQFAFAVALWEALCGKRPFTDGPRGPIARRIERALRRALATDPTARWPGLEPLIAVLAHDPRRLARRVAVVAAVALAAGAVTWLVTRGDAAIDCASATDDSWTPVRAAALRARLAANGVEADRVMGVLDAWVRARNVARVDACEATNLRHTHSAAALDARIGCLERQSLDFDASIGVLRDLPPRAAERAAIVARALPRPSDCRSEVEGGPTDPIARAGEVVVRKAIAESRAQQAAGAGEQALASAHVAVGTADLLRRPGLAAEARIQLAGALYESGTLDGVVAASEQAARLAAEAHDDRTVAEAWLQALNTIGLHEAKLEVADRLIAVADAAVVRAGSPPNLRISLLAERAALADRHGDPRAEVGLLTRTIELATQTYGTDDPVLPELHTRLGAAYVVLRDVADARASLDYARGLLEQLYGERNPHLGVVYTNLGILERIQGNFTQARTYYEAALAIKERALGPDHVALAPTLINLGQTLLDTGDAGAARASALRAIGLIEHAYGPDHFQLATALVVVAEADRFDGDPRSARGALERAIAIQQRVGDVAPLASMLAQLASVDLELHDRASARAAAERALAVATHGLDSAGIAVATESLARVERVEGAATWRKTLRRARDLYARADGEDSPGVHRLDAELGL